MLCNMFDDSERKKVLLIINPISGTLPKDGLAKRVRDYLAPHGMDVEAVETQGPGDGFRLASMAVEKRYYAVIAAGGDGTVNEIASALRATPVALGILPYGSGNGLARHIALSIDTMHSLKIIAKDHVEACDYGTANDIPFFCTFGVGFDAIVTGDYSKMPSRGLAAYARSVLKEYLTYSPTEYEISTGGTSIRVKAFILAVCNASQYGNNAFIAPSASIRDGLLDITIIHKGNKLTRALAGVEMFTGRIDKNILIQTLRVRNAMIRMVPGPAHIDGEPREMPDIIRVECHPGQLRLFTDPDKPRFKPFVTPLRSIQFDALYTAKELFRQFLMKFRR